MSSVLQLPDAGVLSLSRLRQLYFYISHLEALCDTFRAGIDLGVSDQVLYRLKHQVDTFLVLVKTWLRLCQALHDAERRASDALHH